LPYYPIILLSYYPIILLSYYPIILLSYYLITSGLFCYSEVLQQVLLIASFQPHPNPSPKERGFTVDEDKLTFS
ncbi:MAG: hypothetical protein ACOVQ5_11925, partial [Flavobacteriales bacterium]